jgi:hypothetical protein
MAIENVIMYARLDKTKKAKLKRLRMGAGKEYMMTVSKGRPLITFKDMATEDVHYTMLFRKINERIFEIDFHKTFEREEDRHDQIIKIRFGIKEGIQNIEEKDWG